MLYRELKTTGKYRWEWVYLYLFLIAVSLTITLYVFIPLHFEKYKLSIYSVQEKPYPIEFYFYDFDNSGTSNRIELKFVPHSRETAVKLYEDDSSLVDQWNLSEMWLRSGLFWGDYDDNGRSEIYVFTKNDDSLFLYIVDPVKKPFFLKKRAFITKAVDRSMHPQHLWDLYVSNAIFFDTDRDGYKELIISVKSGLSKLPRQVFAYSVHKEKVISSSPEAGMFIGTVGTIFDPVERDTLVGATNVDATHNINYDYPYPDNRSYFCLLRRDLTYKFEPVPYGGIFSGLQLLQMNKENNFNILALLQSRGDTSNLSFLLLLNTSGEELKRKYIPEAMPSNLIKLNAKNKNEYYLLTRDTLWQINERLELFNATPIRDLMKNVVGIYSFSGDSVNQYLVSNTYGYTIYGEGFTDPVIIPVRPDPVRNSIYIRQRLNNKPLIDLDLADSLITYSYDPNPYYPYRYSYPAGLLMLSLILVAGAHKYYRRQVFHNRFSQQLFINAQRGIIVIDHKDNIIRINQFAIDLLGMKGRIVRGVNFYMVFRDYPVLFSVLSTLKESNSEITKETNISGHASNLRIQIKGYPLQRSNDIVYGYFIELTDFSDPIHRERVRLWSNTLQRLAHELKTPLSTIKFALQTIKLKLGENYPAGKALILTDTDILENEISRLNDFLRNFVNMSNLDRRIVKNIHLPDILEKALNQIKILLPTAVKIENEFSVDGAHISGDPVQLENVFHILIKNAADAVGERGVIKVRINVAQNLSDINNSVVCIEIEDNGGGIAPEIKEKIFEPFFSTKQEGFGLGLPMARKVVIEHGGKLEIFSEDSSSTLVRVVLPLGNNGEMNV